MNVPGIQNALAALAALNSSSGSKAPSPSSNAMRADAPASFRQALSREVAQRQDAFQPPVKPQPGARPQAAARPPQAPAQHAPPQAARAQAGDKAKEAKETEAESASSADAAPAPDAASATQAAQASETKPEQKTADDSAGSLADIPGAPQAALMMQLMNTTPAAPADTAPVSDLAPEGKTAGKELAAQGPVDLRAVAGKDEPAAAGVPAAGDAAADLHAAFGKSLADAGRQAAQAAQVLNGAQAEAPATTAAPAALAALQAAVQAVQPPAGPVEKLTPPVGTPAWDQALGQKIVWMAHGGEQTATLTMNPPDLGPMQVVLSVSNNQATVDFMSAQPEVRQALENALPRLREMMGESGVQLGQANVSAGSQQQFAGSGEQNGGRRGKGNDGMAVDDSAAQPRQGVVRIARDGVVDTFA